MLLKLTIVAGDGIGPEVTEEAIRVLEVVAGEFGHDLKLTRKNIGGAALTASNDPLPPDTLAACLSAGAVLLGAVGSPAFDKNPGHLRPEAGLLRLRRELGAYANLRPAVCFPALLENSPLRAEVVKGTDILIVRELIDQLIGRLFEAKLLYQRVAVIEVYEQRLGINREGKGLFFFRINLDPLNARIRRRSDLDVHRHLE